MSESLFQKLGLNQTQTRLYELLLKHGPTSPTQLASYASEKRTTVYMALERLEALAIVGKDEINNKSVYHAKNPIVLRQLLFKQQESLRQSNKELQATLPFLASQYNLNYHQPGVLHLEGAQAIEQLYEDIIRKKQEVLIFPSIHDHDDPEIATLISEQIKKQFKAGIKVKAIYSKKDPITSDQLLVLGRKGVQIRQFGEDPMHFAQIMIYGDTVAMTTFNQGVFTTIINSEMITQTHRAIFENMWQVATEKPA